MDNFGRFLMAQETLEAATQHHNYSGEKLRNAQIRARLAEIASQHEPLNGLVQGEGSARDKLYAAAHYVVVGRMPESPEPEPEPEPDRYYVYEEGNMVTILDRHNLDAVMWRECPPINSDPRLHQQIFESICKEAEKLCLELNKTHRLKSKEV